jgi:CBS domain-containing protein
MHDDRDTRDRLHREREESYRRDFMERAGDEIRSWFGDDQAQRRRRMDEMQGSDRFDRERWERERWGHRYDRDPADRGRYESRYSESAYSDRDRDEDRDRDRHYRDRDRDEREERIHDLMSRNVATVQPQDSVEEAARLMHRHDCGALPVVQSNGRLIGMITDRDLVIRLLARGRDPLRSRVADAMTEEAYAVRMDDDAEAALRVMARQQVRRVPVVDDRDRIVGIVSQADLARHARRGRDVEPREVAETVAEISEGRRR